MSSDYETKTDFPPIVKKAVGCVPLMFYIGAAILIALFIWEWFKN